MTKLIDLSRFTQQVYWPLLDFFFMGQLFWIHISKATLRLVPVSQKTTQQSSITNQNWKYDTTLTLKYLNTA